MKTIVTVLLVLSLINSNAQCRSWKGEPVDSLQPLVLHIESLLNLRLNKVISPLMAAGSFYLIDDSLTVQLQLSVKDAALSLFEINGSPGKMELVWQWIVSTVAGCKNFQIGGSKKFEHNDSYIYFGKNGFEFDRFYYPNSTKVSGVAIKLF